MKWVMREQQRRESDFNAGSKARADCDAILVSEGYEPLIANLEIDPSQQPLKKVLLQFTRKTEWKKSIAGVKPGDTVAIQYPVRNHTIFFGSVLKALNKRGVKTVGIIHDLESLRKAIDKNIPAVSKLRFSLEEVSALKYFSMIIVHNEHMKKAIHEMFDVPMEKMVSLHIFDYLYEGSSEGKAVQEGPVIIAGSLDKNKAGYVYHLPENVPVELFGANLDENFTFTENITYKGKVPPDELPSLLKGSFGIVWDGPAAETCEGVFGEYLKVNNPHKASLYLASGLPLIVWSQSALADYVKKHGCGICVDSLGEIAAAVQALSAEQYAEIVKNVAAFGALVRSGHYLKKAFRTAEARMQ